MTRERDLLGKLKLFEWRGIVLPLINRSISFTSETIEHAFVFKDGEIVEGTGGRNWRLSYTIPFRDGIVVEPFANLYSVVLAGFIKACRDRTEGPLIDPVLGKLNAKFKRFSATTDINRRDGEDIQVEFVHAPAPAEEEPKALQDLGSVVSAAGLLDAEILLTPLGQLPEAPDIGLDALTAITSVGAQFQNYGALITAKLDGFVSKLEAIEEQLVELEDPTEWQAIRDTRKLQNAARDLAQRALDPGRAIVKLTTKVPQSIAAIAGNTGMSPQDLMTLNPKAALGGAMIPAGTAISYYKEAA